MESELMWFAKQIGLGYTIGNSQIGIDWGTAVIKCDNLEVCGILARLAEDYIKLYNQIGAVKANNSKLNEILNGH